MSVLEPFSIGVIPLLARLNARLTERLNYGQNQGELWRPETGQLACSKRGAQRVIWKLVGGPIEIGPFAPQGNTAPAPNLNRRHPVIEAEIRAIDPRTSGLTVEDLNMAEKVMRQVLFVLSEKHSGDVIENSIREDWSRYTESPSQGQVILVVQFGLRVLNHDDPYNLQPYTTTTATGVLAVP